MFNKQLIVTNGSADIEKADYRVSEKRFIEITQNFSKLSHYYIESENKGIPENISKILKERKSAILNGDFQESKRLKDLIFKKGYRVLDIHDDQILERVS